VEACDEKNGFFLFLCSVFFRLSSLSSGAMMDEQVCVLFSVLDASSSSYVGGTSSNY